MTDQNDDQKYQEILNKYAADLASVPATETQESQDSETQPEPAVVQMVEVPSAPPTPPTPPIPLPTTPPEIQTPDNQAVAAVDVLAPPVITPIESPLEITPPSPPTPAAETPQNPTKSPLTPPLPPPSSPTMSSSSVNPTSSSIFKYICLLSFIVFLVVAGNLIWTLIKMNKLSAQKGSLTLSPTPSITLTETNVTPTIDLSKMCNLNDKTYAIGDSFPAADGCNVCTCNSSLTFDCTQKICSPSATDSATSATSFIVSKMNPSPGQIVPNSLSYLEATLSNPVDAKTVILDNVYVVEGETKLAGKPTLNTKTNTIRYTFTKAIINTNKGADRRITVVLTNIKSTKGDILPDTKYDIDIH